MKLFFTLGLTLSVFTAIGCASTPARPKNLEKYPQCYHINPKISKRCVDKNEAGESTTALQLENTAYPGEYK